jgi:hypothetical protein
MAQTWIDAAMEARLETRLAQLRELSAPMTDAFKHERYGEGIEKYVEAVAAKLTDLPSQ